MQYLVLLLLLVGCGVQENERPEFNRVLKVEGFEHYVNLFQEQAKDLGQDIEISDLIVTFRHIPIENNRVVLGVCWRGGNNTPRIHIDPEHWSELSMIQRELLMFHELGHCVLRRDHVENVVSIMNPSLLSKDIFVKNEDRLLAELFDDSQYGGLELNDSTYSSRCNDFSSGILSGMGN